MYVSSALATKLARSALLFRGHRSVGQYGLFTEMGCLFLTIRRVRVKKISAPIPTNLGEELLALIDQIGFDATTGVSVHRPYRPPLTRLCHPSRLAG